MVHFFLPSQSLLSVPAPTIAAIFVTLDFVSFAVQLVGGSMGGPTSSAEDQLKAIHIYMGGIGLQEFFIVVFVGLGVKFHVEMSRLERYSHGRTITGWRTLLYTLFASLGLITVRGRRR